MKESLTLRSLNYGDTFRFAHRDGMFRFLGLFEPKSTHPGRKLYPVACFETVVDGHVDTAPYATGLTDAQVIRIAHGPAMGGG